VSSPYLKHAPKHRAPKARRAPKAAALKKSLALSSMAVVATGLAVGGGSLALTADGGSDGGSSDSSMTAAGTAGVRSAVRDVDPAEAGSEGAGADTDIDTEAGSDSPADSTAEGTTRAPVTTRSDNRAEGADPAKVDVLSMGSGNAMARTEDLSDEDPRLIAQALLAEFGFDQDQFGCLDSLWTRESNWTVTADNPTSSAYGIPQALPGSKMSTAGADWATNPVTQIRWGLGYIQDRYGSPCAAWGHSQSSGFY
jgi:hypothetical protein